MFSFLSTFSMCTQLRFCVRVATRLWTKEHIYSCFSLKKKLYLKNNNILTFNSLSNMLFLTVEQTYLHGWKAGDVKILYL